METIKGERKQKEITLEQARDLIEMLTGGATGDDIHLAHQPHLTKPEAFSVLYYLQEKMYIISVHFEMCADCGELYDDQHGGGTRQSDNANICDPCSSGYDFCVSCCELVDFGTTDEDGSECEKCREVAK